MTISRRGALTYTAGAGVALAAVPAHAARGNAALEAALTTLHTAMFAGDGAVLDGVLFLPPEPAAR